MGHSTRPTYTLIHDDTFDNMSNGHYSSNNILRYIHESIHTTQIEATTTIDATTTGNFLGDISTVQNYATENSDTKCNYDPVGNVCTEENANGNVCNLHSEENDNKSVDNILGEEPEEHDCGDYWNRGHTDPAHCSEDKNEDAEEVREQEFDL